uniref:Uncharacterized protein n=1 Tax=Panagrolaimus sp. ES5 TaxID=591445 RepID=A0AC34G9F7_9BILA
MKFRCVLSIFIFLITIFQFQLSDAVLCLKLKWTDKPIKMKNKITAFDNPTTVKEDYVIDCNYACAMYFCIKNSSIAFFGAGCPNDFYDLCSRFTIALKEVKEKGPNNLDYHNDIFTVYYSSGCGSESDGRQCILDKFKLYKKKTDKEYIDLENNDLEKYAAIQRKRTYIKYLLNGGTTPTSDSNNENDAMK